MPFFRFHFVEKARLAEISEKMTDQLQAAMGCPREHIVLEVIHADVVEHSKGAIMSSWPFVAVEYFERPREVQHKVAAILHDCLTLIGYVDSDIHFFYLQPENYYENGKCME
jgi:hypothetical protein